MRLIDAPQVGDDAGIRQLLGRISTLEARLAEVQAAAAGNQGSLDFLAAQTVSAEASPGSLTTVTTNPATSGVANTWVPFDSSADASCQLTTSSTGRIAVQAGGYLWLAASNFCTQYGYIGVEILDANGNQLREPHNGDGNMSSLWGQNNSALNANSGHRHEWQLTPWTTYTLRCRRGYAVGAGSTGAIAIVSFQGTALSITKLGM